MSPITREVAFVVSKSHTSIAHLIGRLGFKRFMYVDFIADLLAAHIPALSQPVSPVHYPPERCRSSVNLRVWGGVNEGPWGRGGLTLCGGQSMVFAIVVDKKGRSREGSRIAPKLPYYFPRASARR